MLWLVLGTFSLLLCNAISLTLLFDGIVNDYPPSLKLGFRISVTSLSLAILALMGAGYWDLLS